MEKNMRIDIRVTKEEYDLIFKKMQMCHMKSISAYIRKMAIDGIVIKLDFPELKEICSLLRYAGNNINQMAKRLHEGRPIYEKEIREIQEKQSEICEGISAIPVRLQL